MPATTMSRRAASPIVDEDLWEVPATWWRQAEPFRGRGPARPARLDDRAPAAVAALVASVAREFAGLLDGPGSDAELRAAAARHLAGAPDVLGASQPERTPGEPTPWGAAVVAATLGAALGWSQRAELAAVADQWVVEHGPGFAVQAAMLLPRVARRSPGPDRWAMLRVDGDPFRAEPHHRFDGPRSWTNDEASWDLLLHTYDHHHEVLRRLRAVLAGLDDRAYARAVAAARTLRPEGIGQRVVSSYLLPTEQEWVTGDIEELAASRPGYLPAMLFASVTTPRQVACLTSLHVDVPEVSEGRLWSAAAHAGPGVEPLIRAMLPTRDRFSHLMLDPAERKRVLGILARLPTDSAFQLLIDRLGERDVAPALAEALARFPRRGMRLLAAAAAAGNAAAVEDLLRGHVTDHPELVGNVVGEVGAALPRPARILADAAAPRTTVPAAPADLVPAVLRTPPWTRRVAPIVLEGLARPVAPALAWEPGERERWENLGLRHVHVPTDQAHGQGWPETLADIPAGGNRYGVLALAQAPEDLVRPLLRRGDLATPSQDRDLDPLRVLLGRYGDDALPHVCRVAVRRGGMAAALLPVEGPQIALAFARWLARSATVREVALAWFARHPAAAARDLVPVALSRPGKDRAAAEAALRLIDPAVVTRAAAAYGPEAVDGVAPLLVVTGPLDRLPVQMPSVPTWLHLAHLPPLLLAGGRGALPPDAVRSVLLMLMLCRPGEPYAGVALVREACDPASLARWSWAVFERWRAAGYPPRDGWVLDGLGRCGDDQVVRELVPLIRAWPGESAQARAVAALDVLAGIGTDTALMHLHHLAGKGPSWGVRTRAGHRLAGLAAELGLTGEQVADRIVPDLGLDERGTAVLDYGPRTFTVRFDEQLEPVVLDADGSRRRILPRPSARDDPASAPAAYARFRDLRKDVRAIARDQVRRREREMVAGRRWTGAEHRRVFVEHPLLRHLAGRLVWATFDGRGVPTGSFRVADDRTLVDCADEPVTVADDALVGIAHPLHLDDATRRAWSALLGDHLLPQPFDQLDRAVFALTPAERSADALDRLRGATVPTVRVLGMDRRGWQRARETELVREVGGHRVVVDLDPGVVAGDAAGVPEQALGPVRIHRPGRGGPLPFGVLDDIAASELLRDLHHLRDPDHLHG